MSDPWWRRRKKKSRWFSDIYDELEKLGDMIDETMDKAFDVQPKNSSIRPNRAQSFYLKIDPNGKSWIREINGSQPIPIETEFTADLKPLIDLIDNGKNMSILVALPGISKDNIDLRLTQNCISISVDTDEFQWNDEFNLPTKVKPKSARASYKNGILEIHLEKLERNVKDNNIFMKK
ncbi:Hsp20/alpha crystallin family protein [Candidatus Bathyarchaeota archaeon]|nr:Hsp20/alpha crystallin family protein [Candidatus Bathyarchaeota archaeon]